MPLLLLKYWKYIAIAIAVVAVFWWHLHAVHSARLDERSIIEARWKASVISDAEESRKAVDAAKAEAQAERDKSAREREASENKERVRQEDAEKERSRFMHDLESRYKAALVNNQECAAWSRVPVACPVR